MKKKILIEEHYLVTHEVVLECKSGEAVAKLDAELKNPTEYCVDWGDFLHLIARMEGVEIIYKEDSFGESSFKSKMIEVEEDIKP